MASHLGLPMSDLTADDKVAYKKEMRRLAKGGKTEAASPGSEKRQSKEVPNSKETNKTE
jgi:hypothetical protein